MGVLTGDMTRLRDEVLASRGARAAIRRDLVRGTKDLTKTVAGMLDAFHDSHTKMAKRTHAERGAFKAGVEAWVNGLRRAVVVLKREFASDLQGAHRAWSGTGRTAGRHGKAHAARKGRRA